MSELEDVAVSFANDEDHSLSGSEKITAFSMSPSPEVPENSDRLFPSSLSISKLKSDLIRYFNK